MITHANKLLLHKEAVKDLHVTGLIHQLIVFIHHHKTITLSIKMTAIEEEDAMYS